MSPQVFSYGFVVKHTDPNFDLIQTQSAQPRQNG